MNIEQWNKLSYEEKQKAISRHYYYGIDELLRRFVEIGCYSEQNPNQDQAWCSCGKPFCYECVAGRIISKLERNIYEPLIQQAKAEVAREIKGKIEKVENPYSEASKHIVHSAFHEEGFEDCRQAILKTLES